MNLDLFSKLFGSDYKVKMTGPEIYTTALVLNTKVPDKVGLPPLTYKGLPMVFALDSESVCQYHVGYTTDGGQVMQEYKTVKIRANTYKKLKILAIKLDISVIELINRLYKTRQESGLIFPAEG